MSRTAEFVTLSDAAARAVSGPSSRHAALIEDAFDVLVETPGGGVALTGDVRGRASAMTGQAAAVPSSNAKPTRRPAPDHECPIRMSSLSYARRNHNSVLPRLVSRS